MKNAYGKLREPTKRWYNRYLRTWEFEEHEKRTLLLAAQMWDESQRADDVLQEEGRFILDRFNQKREHPALKAKRDCVAMYFRLVRELGFDIQEPGNRAPTRPGGY